MNQWSQVWDAQDQQIPHQLPSAPTPSDHRGVAGAIPEMAYWQPTNQLLLADVFGLTPTVFSVALDFLANIG